MSPRAELRISRKTKARVINATSKRQEKTVVSALIRLVQELKDEHGSGIEFIHSWEWKLRDVVEEMKGTYPDIAFHYHFDSSCMSPDGGILCLKPASDDKFIYPILIAEVKHQGTNPDYS